MSLALVHSRALRGLAAEPVAVEVHLANGLPSFTLVGLVDLEVREARERVRSALQHTGLEFPTNRRITANLAPADLPKDSGRFDLPLALGILAAAGQVQAQQLEALEFAGELSLSGQLRPVRGALAMGLALRRHNAAHPQAPRALVLPPGSAEEAAVVPGITVFRAAHLLDVVQALLPGTPPLEAQEASEGWRRVPPPPAPEGQPDAPDLADLKGQSGARRALEIAAAGAHALLLVGPPGSGKSMLAHRLAGVLPPLSAEEALESAAIASLAGCLVPERWMQRPTRTPHHTASAVALVGGGQPPRPGEISLAHQGVLFLDELPEFPRTALEALREPLESGSIHIVRAAQRAQFPARFQLVAAMNPCPCGYWGSTVRACRCTPDQVRRYQARLSGPLLDRIDLQVEVPALAPQELLQAPAGEPSAPVRERVMAARERALQRQGCVNQQLQGRALEANLHLTPEAQAFLQKAATRLGWSARATHRALRVARTIADLDGSEAITPAQVAESLQYRRALFQPQG